MPEPKRGNQFFLLVIVSQIVTMFIISFVINYMLSQPSEKINIPFVNTMSQFLSFGVPFFIYLALTRQRTGDSMRHEKLNFTNIFLIIGMTIALRPVCSMISSITSLFSENTTSDFLLSLYSYPFAVVVFVLCITPAIAEEVILRGVVLSNYNDVSIKKAAVVNGLFFGFLHLNIQQFFYAFFIGFIFTYFVRYTKSIYASILAHFIFNFAQAFPIYGYIRVYGYSKLVEELSTEPSLQDMITSISFNAITSVIMLPVFLILFFAFIRYNITRNLIEEFLREDVSEHEGEPEACVEIRKTKVFDPAFAGVVLTYLFAMEFIFS